MSRAEVPWSTPLMTIRTRPAFSRTSIRPSGVQANAVGWERVVTTAVSENPAIAYVAVRPAAGVRARTRIARKNERRAEAPPIIRGRLTR